MTKKKAKKAETQSPRQLPTARQTSSLPEDRYFNREFSWLAFNERVLEEAQNPKHPLLERVKFLAISDSNLEEFFSVRVAGLKGQVEAGVDKPSIDGLTPNEQLLEISRRSKRLISAQQHTWQTLQNELVDEGISFITATELTKADLEWLKTYFQQHLFAALTPMAVDPAHPFPFIPNDGFVMVLKLKQPKKNKIHWALLPIPKMLPRFVLLETTKRRHQFRFISLEHLLPLFFDQMFPGFEILTHGLVHLIRDSEIDINEDVDDLVEMYRKALKLRRQGSVIRLVVHGDFADDMLEFLVEELEVDDSDIYKADTMINLSDLMKFKNADFPAHLSFNRFTPKASPHFAEFDGNCFAAIKKRDILLHHPYQSFDAVVNFIKQAARDPNVIAIKQTLYRTTTNSPIARALMDAAEAGKSVTAVVELKARFDEEKNIDLANDLEQAGVHVVYGVIGLKTHAKMTLVVRKEQHGIQNYVHFGTGNYHPVTAKQYTDVSLFTCNPSLCDDAVKVFNYVTGYGIPKKLHGLSISPVGLMDKLYRLIEDEIQYAQSGHPGEIWIKLNSLVDPTMIDAMYRASQAGVKINLIVRGICCLKPGVIGLSENIRVKSIVGRFLEHTRAICFGRGKSLPNNDARVFISSADWMPRNFYTRVETLVEILDPAVKHQLVNELMAANINDNEQSWDLEANGKYHRHFNTPEQVAFNAQDYFMEHPQLPSQPRVHKLPKPPKA